MTRSIKQASRLLLSWSAGGAVMVALVALYCQLRYGSPRALPVLLRGDGLLVSPPHVDLGDVEFGDRRDVVLTLKNVSDRELRVTGFRTTCTCVAATDLPLTLTVGGEGELILTILARALVSRYRHTATLYVSGNTSGEVPVPIVAEIDPASIPKLEKSATSSVPPQRAAGKSRS